jgi:hypothetical protein
MLGQAMLFSFDEHQKQWRYGATPSDLTRNNVVFLTPKQFIEAFYARLNTDVRGSAAPLCQLVQQARNYFSKHGETPEGVTRASAARDTAAAAALLLHHIATVETVTQTVNKIKYCACAPPDSDSIITARMQKWGALTDADFASAPDTTTTVIFSVPDRSIADRLLQPLHATTVDCKIHAFMHSQIVSVAWPIPSSGHTAAPRQKPVAAA